MFTVEFEPDASVIVSIDETDNYHDIEMIIGDDGTVILRQFIEEMEEHQVIYISYQQLLDLLTSLRQTEGAYYLTNK
jgi:hypothetical protein